MRKLHWGVFYMKDLPMTCATAMHLLSTKSACKQDAQICMSFALNGFKFQFYLILFNVLLKLKVPLSLWGWKGGNLTMTVISNYDVMTISLAVVDGENSSDTVPLSNWEV